MGHLTRSLCERLVAVDPASCPGLRWGRIWRQVEAAVVARNPQQRPWLSAGFGRAVFGGDPTTGATSASPSSATATSYQLDVGTLAGVTEGARIGVYGPEPVMFPPLGSPVDLAARRGELRVRSADPAGSRAVPVAPMALPEAARGRLVAPGADARIAVAFCARRRRGGRRRTEPFAVRQGRGRCAARRPRAATGGGGGWVLADDVFGDERWSSRASRPFRYGRPDLLRAVVEHYYRYRAPLRLASACRDLPTMLGVSLLDCNARRLWPAEAQRGPPRGRRNRPRPLRGAGRATGSASPSTTNPNATSTSRCSMRPPAAGCYLLGTGQIPARARERFWSTNHLGTPFAAQLPRDQQVGVDRIVAIGTTESGVDLSYLRQDTGFAELIHRVGGPKDRDLGQSAVPAPPAEQYTAAVADLWIRR